MFDARNESKKMTHSKYQGLKNNSSKILLALHLPIDFLHLLTWMLRRERGHLSPPGTYIIALFGGIVPVKRVLCGGPPGGHGLAVGQTAH
jgi:hypothetical protein